MLQEYLLLIGGIIIILLGTILSRIYLKDENKEVYGMSGFLLITLGIILTFVCIVIIVFFTW